MDSLNFNQRIGAPWPRVVQTGTEVRAHSEEEWPGTVPENVTSPLSSGCRWKWSHTSWMISCVMNVRGPVAGESLLHFSALMLPVCSITVNIAGLLFILVLAGSSTSRWWRRAGTVLGIFHSAGTRGELQCSFSGLRISALFCSFCPSSASSRWHALCSSLT